ncbi:MAG: serine hydrolase [Verrucomicrobiales bacterium]
MPSAPLACSAAGIAAAGFALLASAPAAESPPPFDIIVKGGRIVDGTGAPWYAADLAIKDGAIARIGPLGDAKAKTVIDAAGLIVAPGFIDMMGQTAAPFLDDSSAAMNLLTQGITTINAGEGHSGAPLDAESARAEGWSTMAEYFQILDLRGLPVNVAQTVGHTQVRRLVMGDSDRQPDAAELAKMQGYVREAMEAGAIGVSTALIYPPAVYADTSEIAALVSVAGEYGGRYYTLMRNEGDQLLEAIDEALEIGQKGNAPVHIFHLKAAGRQNWAKMDEAVAKIKAARAGGRQVTADIYPYINNGLGIAAFIHPRHFTGGWGALVARLDDADLRKAIRAEMESDEGEWENWFKHVGRDWGKVIIGRADGLRFKGHAGKSLAEIAAHFEADPWDVFFDLVKVDAFATPESMSEENKRRLIGEEFVSFCTDVGPASKSGISAHPRAYGAFPRLLSRYVRDGQAASLERAIAQASAAAANNVLAYDRGRIAVGLAADIIAFDYEKLADRATFADPHQLSEGMRYVIVNGEVVLDGGKMTDHLPGRVLRGPGWDPAKAPPQVMTGEAPAGFEAVDAAVRDFMRENHIPGAALAITDGQRLAYARGFGYADIAAGEKATPTHLFRIASISKPVTAAVIFRLIEDGKLSLDDKVFDLLDYAPPKEDDKVDERLGQITIRQLLQHTGGWDRDASFDAMFKPVEFAKALGVPPPAGPDEVIRNMMAQPLDFDPGTKQVYSNFGYCLLGRVIEKLGGQPYEAFTKAAILDPAGAKAMRLGKSLPEGRAEGEVRYYSPWHGGSVFADMLNQRVPYPYGGWHLEAMDAHGAWIASPVDLVRFASALPSGALLTPESLAAMQDVPPGEVGHGKDGAPRKRCYACGWRRDAGADGATYSHSGSLAGTATLLVRRPDNRCWAIVFNSRSGPKSSHWGRGIEAAIEKAIDAVGDWPEEDLFPKFAD